MVSLVKSGFERLAAIENPVGNVVVFTIPIVNIIVRKMKEDTFRSWVATTPGVSISQRNEVKHRFERLFLIGAANQLILGIASLALAILIVPPCFATVCLTSFAIFWLNAAVSLPAHFYLGRAVNA